MKLYIIGNGFDLAHGLKTTYFDYKEFIKNNIKVNYKWKIILDFYPDNYEFWSDIEYNVCNIDCDLYFNLKKIYGFGFLDDLYRQIHKSFDRFILKVESNALTKKPIFSIDKSSLFLTFNYTSLLEDLYKVPENNIVYVHNDISGPAFELLYNLDNKSPCIIGHSTIDGDYRLPIDGRLLQDKEYLDYVESTTKRSEDIMLRKGIKSFVCKHKNEIKEIVYYGFSFSITDKRYIQTIHSILPNSPVIVFYKRKRNETQEQSVSLLKQRISLYGIEMKYFSFVDCDSTKIL